MIRRRLSFRFFFFTFSFGLAAPCLGATGEPTNGIADYYASRYDFKEAEAAYAESLGKQPENLTAAIRLSEIQLMQEGRPTARATLLKLLTKPEGGLSREAKKTVRDQWTYLNSFFLTDQAQTFFLQGLAMKQRKDCEGAVGLFQQAAALEGGNIQVLKEKALCEQQLKTFDRLYETFQSLHDADPFNPEFGQNLAETFLYFREYRKASELLRKDPDFVKDARGQTAYAVAIAEQGFPEPALHALQEVTQREEAEVPSVVWYQLGVLLSRKDPSRPESAAYLKKFLALYSPQNTSPWDPYRLEEKAAEARRLLAARGK